MNTSKIIRGVVSSGRYTVTAPIIKEDYGLYLQIEGVELPSTYQVDFSNDEHHGTSVTMIGNSDGVLIPSQFISSGKDVFAFLYHVGEDFGRTVYKFRIPNKVRPDRTEEQPTPEEQSVIDQAINALNEAVAHTAQDVESADQSARSASDDADRAERAKTSAETAQRKAEEAQESAERAKDDAQTSERNASESERKAKGYAETASAKADAITGLTAQATTLPDGSSATANYNPETGVMSFGIPKGKDGKDGTNGIDGDDGYSPTANVSKSGKTATITITDKNGTTSAQVSDGEDGTDGTDGISPSVTVTDITGGHRVVITDKDGAKSFDVEDGATGATPNLTIGTVETLEPSESATANITGTPENPVLNLGIPQGDTGEVTLEDYYKAFPTDSASGSIASFPDGADDIPLKSLIVNINPVQDLNGYDSPWVGGGHYNILDEEFEEGRFDTTTGANVATSTQLRTKNINKCLPNTQYYFSSTYSAWFIFYDGDGNVITTPTIPEATTISGNSVSIPKGTFTTPTGAYGFRIYLNTSYGTTYNHDIAINYPSTVTTYSPYENICPISGWTGCNIQRDGTNLFDGEMENGDINQYTGENNGTSSSHYRSKNYIPIRSGSYYFKSPNRTTGTVRVFFYDANKTFIYFTAWNVNAVNTFDNGRVRYARFRFGTAKVDGDEQISINSPSSVTDYVPYVGASIPISWQTEAGTVYGGKLDVLSGKLKDEQIAVDLSTLSWSVKATGETHKSVYARLPKPYIGHPRTSENVFNPILEQYTKSGGGFYTGFNDSRITNPDAQDIGYLYYSNSGTPRTSILYMIVDVDATPSGLIVYNTADTTEIQLTPHEVNSLLGVNNIFADTGDATVEYRADTKLYIEKLTQPEEDDMIADSAITSGQFFMVGNSLYRALANIASGATITVGTNAQRVSLSDALNLVNA